MNIPVLLFFIVLVAALTVVIIKANSRSGSDAFKTVLNVGVGICLVFSIMFLPFGNTVPESLYGRALNALNPNKPEPEKAEEPAGQPAPADIRDEKDEKEEEELPDFIVYECEDYYIGMDKEEHIMKIFPSEQRLENAKEGERLAYYSFSGEYELDGHTLNVYAARLAGDPGFVSIVLFEEYHKGKTNPGFTESDALFRLYDEDNGYMYGFAYTYDSVESSHDYGFRIGNKRVGFDGLYEALKLDKQYFEDDG